MSERQFEWKIIERKQLFKDRWADIKVDTCQRPNGSLITPYYVYGFPDYACAVAFTRDGKIILERIYRHGLGVVAPELPGGCIDKEDINIEDAIARELLEETGYRFDKIEHLGTISPNPAVNTNVMQMFLATGGVFDETATLDVEEDVEVFLVTMDEFLQMFEANQFLQSMQVCAIYEALKKLGKLEIKP